MATSYHYLQLDIECGPVSFRDLVRLVREGALRADDLVKADWECEWHPAADVVGLFHMAGRADVVEGAESEAAEERDVAPCPHLSKHFQDDQPLKLPNCRWPDWLGLLNRLPFLARREATTSGSSETSLAGAALHEECRGTAETQTLANVLHDDAARGSQTLNFSQSESKNASLVAPLVIAGVLILVAGPLAGLLYLGTHSCES